MSRPVTATYRLQFGGETTFDRAARIAPYLARLGISHLYASPIFQARSGSTHGYDVADYNCLSEALGGREGFDRMVAALHENGLGLILDIVPNHMAASPENAWLADVMRRGQDSEHAATFDIDWDKSGGKLVLPVLGAPLDEVVAKGELTVADDDRLGRALDYYGARFPLAEGTGQGDLTDTVREQNFELSYWRDLDKLNYRRFFDITDLIGVRMEEPSVFDRSHALLRELIEAGAVDGVRVDHVDGMRDPKGYLDRLAALFPEQHAPPVWVEKIVEGEERVPASWPVRGETGYSVMPWLDGVLTDQAAEGPLTELYGELAGDHRGFHEVEQRAKREIMDGPFAHEFGTLAAQVAKRADLDPGAVRSVLEDVAAAFPVYRTYLPAEGEADRLRGIAEELRADHATAVFDTVLDVLTDPSAPEALSFQQMTGPVMAKSVEDTSFYRWHRWAALNEVGGDPSAFGRSPGAFHERMAERAEAEPLALSATATHDTKRGEDVRARLAAATHDVSAWQEAARAWFAATESQREGVAPVTAYLVFQTLVGFWPTRGEDEEAGLADRLTEYALKAARERKRDTSWTDQDETYEEHLEALTRAACEGELANIVRDLTERLTEPAADLSVARAVLKATIPGVPDTYQGTELTDLSLVDPDNRRPVDFDRLAQQLDGDAPRKLAATAALLGARRADPDLFLRGRYEPKDAGMGVLAFDRAHEGRTLHVAVAIAPGAELPVLEGEPVLDDPAARVTLSR